MRAHRLYAHDAKGHLPRMSWAPQNLYSLIARSTSPTLLRDMNFQRTSMSMYQQRWRAKRLLRAYHGNWIREKRFKRWYLPASVSHIDTGRGRRLTSTASGEMVSPMQALGRGASGASNVLANSAAYASRIDERLPVASLFTRDVERRIDTTVFRCCFARSAYEARTMVVHGRVKVNGRVTLNAGHLLSPGDLISVDSKAVPMLGEELERQATQRHAAEMALRTKAFRTMSRDGAEPSNAEASSEAVEAKSAEEAEGEAETDGTAASTPTAEASDAKETEAPSPSAQDKGKGREEPSAPETSDYRNAQALAPGVRPFNLPPYAAPFLFIPGHLEVSFTTCSAIYIRHPTIMSARDTQVQRGDGSSAGIASRVSYTTDIASPYPATGEIFAMAWEYYSRNSPRTRSDLRRLQVEARTGRKGFASARAKDAYKKERAARRGHLKRDPKRGSDVVVAPMAGPASTTGKTASPRRRGQRQFLVGGRGASVVGGNLVPRSQSNTSAAARAV